jgi:UPF0716 protein FxsA
LIRLLLLFTVVPFVELSLLLWLGARMGLINTLLLIAVTGVAGASLARREGFGILTRLQSEIAEGAPPESTLIEAVLIFAGGLLLITPGVLTDIAGFSMVLPGSRAFYAAHLREWFMSRVRVNGRGMRDTPHVEVPSDADDFEHPVR